jgi:hypothetical protein
LHGLRRPNGELHDRFNTMNYFAFSIWKCAEIRRLMRGAAVLIDVPGRGDQDQTDAQCVTMEVCAENRSRGF